MTRRGLDYDPHEHAQTLKVDVTHGPLPPGWRGAYDHAERRITLTPGMTRREERSTLAHEVQHHVRGDEWLPRGAESDRREQEVEQRAALLLIHPLQYLAASTMNDSYRGTLVEVPKLGAQDLWRWNVAVALQVTRRVLDTWLAIQRDGPTIDLAGVDLWRPGSTRHRA